LGLASAASRTTNPLLLLMIMSVAGVVVAARRSDAPWALAFRLYLALGAVIVLMRVVFRVVFGGGQGDHVLFVLPQVPLPDLAAGIRLFGPVTAEQVLGGLYDGLRLATMLVCVGAANALANPKRMLKTLPGALYEVGASVVIALSVAPQLVQSVQRVRRARRLRAAGERGMRALHGIVVPVLTDALDRSLALAAAMDSRGYGRTGDVPPVTRRLTGALVVTGLLGVCVGIYGLMDSSVVQPLGVPVLAGGLLVALAGFVVAGHRVRRTTYRPDRWRAPELLVVASGLAAATLMHLTGGMDAAGLYPSLSPLAWPRLDPLPALGVLVGLAPAVLAPRPPPSMPSAGPPSVPRPEAVR
jgi:energy-coupling factor transport system permease protein